MKKLRLNKLAPFLWEHIPFFMRLAPFIIRILLIFERFFTVVSFIILNRQLRSLRSKGRISKYRLNIIRNKKLNYKIEIGIVLSDHQVNLLFNELTELFIERVTKYQTIINLILLNLMK